MKRANGKKMRADARKRQEALSKFMNDPKQTTCRASLTVGAKIVHGVMTKGSNGTVIFDEKPATNLGRAPIRLELTENKFFQYAPKNKDDQDAQGAELPEGEIDHE